MKKIALLLTLGIAAPATAQTSDDDGTTLMEQGARLFMRGIMTEMAPALEDLEGLAREIEPALKDFVTEMGPAVTRLMGAVDDIRNYEGPVILDNGDILIRRRADAPPYVAPDAEPEEIEL